MNVGAAVDALDMMNTLLHTTEANVARYYLSFPYILVWGENHLLIFSLF